MNANYASNQLSQETSPYLLQHAHNPVHWMPWSYHIFDQATTQNKPILLSIGYAACHWCHVMERESFESATVAAYMNAHFINVKVDREERPDVDHIYMDALQAMTGSGGWPLNIFLLPDGKPFYGGTYFPPKPMPQRASWMDVLKGVHDAYTNNKEKLIEQALHLTSHLVQTNIQTAQGEIDENELVATTDEVALMAQKILQGADKIWGGFGKAPKFPQTFSMQLLLRNYALNQDIESLEHVLFSLDKMIQGGIYDHLGGGFSRYSTDAQWQAPHFEKMLYDNALLLTVLAEAYQITNKEQYALTIQETIGFLNRELSNGDNAFYAALDADSEGIEGQFYTWTYDELQSLIDPDFFDFFCSYYQIMPAGNWEHRNILWTLDAVPEEKKLALKKAKDILFAARAKKIRPALDFKIILSWNNLMIIGFCKCFAALGLEEYRHQAIQTMDWIESHLFNADENCFYHTNTKGVKKSYAFLEDYATLIQAYIQLQEVTGDTRYLYKAKKWMEYVQVHFIDEQNVFYYFTAAYQKDMIVRKKENYDGAQPSGNAMLASALQYLGVIFDQAQWQEQSKQMVRNMRKLLLQYPASFGYWGQCFYVHAVGFTELVGIGSSVQNHLNQVLKRYLPQRMLVFLPTSDPNISITKGKQSIENQYFICKAGTCSPAISNLSDFLALF
jgi:hypothetical protein